MSSSLGRAGIWAGAAIATGLSLLLAVTAPAAPPTLTLVATDAVIGQTIDATAELSESPDATGEITFEVFGPDDPTCAGPALESSQATVSGDGQYVSADFTATAAGPHRWSARYSGDDINPAPEALCAATSTVTKASPAMTGSASSGVVGTAIHDEVTLTGGFTPGGEVTFAVFAPGDTTCATPLETMNVEVAGSEAVSDDFISQQAGEFRWTASYEGDANNEAAALGCDAAGQASSVAKASPGLAATATSTVVVGNTITDQATLSGAFSPGGEIVFRAYGPGDPSCGAAPAYEATVPVNANGPYSPAGFAPGPGLYRWTVDYGGDGNNEAAGLACGAANQTSAVSKASPSLAGTATSTVVVGQTITDQVNFSAGFQPGGELVFRAYGPGDATCGNTAAYETTVAVNGNGSYSPAGFAPGPGLYRWVVEYEGDANNEAAALGCNAAGQASSVAKASPGLAATATSTVVVGNTITDQATLSGAFSPGGEIVFRAYGPGDPSCGAAPAYEATVPVNANGPYSPAGFAPGPGLYRWTVDYGGDGNNEAAGLACGAANQTSAVSKASPSLAGTATSTVVVGQTITDQVNFSAGFQPGGELVFRAYGPGDATCGNTAAYETTVAVNGNGSYSPAGFAPGPGLYRWVVEYEGDANNEAAALGCNAAGQASSVAKASPGLAATATSTVVVGNTITDQATLSGAFSPGGEIVFRAYGPGDPSCGAAPAYEATVPVNANGPYSPAGFAPGPGLYRWTVDYAGDGNNEAVGQGCDAEGQGSAVGVIDVTLAGSATGGTVGTPVTATATLREAAIPGGEMVFKAFPPGDVNCSGAAAFSSAVSVTGNGSYRSAAFVPTGVGTFRWTVAYSGDPNHAPAAVGCGIATSAVAPAGPTIAGAVPQRVPVGAAFRDAATLQGGYSPGGTITFRIYGPINGGCAGPAFVNTVKVNGNGTVNSDPFVALRAGRYSFQVSYSGDAKNQAASEPCDSPTQVVQVVKRAPKVKPRARLIGSRQISIRARLSGGVSPSGAITFRLYGPGDKRCSRKPAFGGGVTVKSNGTFPLARYIATKAGVYRLSVGYSGDQRNQRYKGSCDGAQPIRVGKSP